MPHITSPLGYFNEIFFINMKRYQNLMGLNFVTNPNYKPIFRTYFWLGLVYLFLVLTIYTMIAYDADTAWKAFSFFGLGIQGVVKFSVLICYAAEIHNGIEFLHVVYKSNLQRTSANYKTLLRWGKIAYIVLRVSASIAIASCIVFVPMNLLENYRSAKRLSLMETYIFGIDEQTDIGYAIVYVYHLIMLFLAAVGVCSVDLVLIMFLIHMCPLVELFDNMFKELNEAVKDPKRRESKELKQCFENIIKIHSDICGYLENVSSIFSSILFCEVGSDALSLCVLIFCILTMDDIEMYFYTDVTLISSKLFICCFLGTIVEICTDRINDTLMASNWYLLPLPQQRNMIVMLQRAQNPTTLKAGTAPLNMNTFVSVVKTAYSVGMLLIQSLED